VTVISLSACIATEENGQSSARAEAALYKNAEPIAIIGETRLYDIDVTRAAIAAGVIDDGDVLAPNASEYSELLDQLIDQRLLLIEAQAQKLQADPEVQWLLKDARERVLSRRVVEKRLKDAVSDEALRKLYNSQSALRQNGREADISRIRAETQDEIKTVAKRLSAGEDFKELAKALSTDSATRENGGNLGFVSRAMLSDIVAQTAFALTAGGVSKPFKTSEGWEIIKVNSFRLPQQASFEAMLPQLKAFQTYKVVQELMTELRDNTEVERLISENGQAGSLNNISKEDKPNE
jgi:peptidyl-prolyl cis-trans isomerase C